MSYAIGEIIYGLDLTARSYSSNSPAYDALKDITDDDGEYLLSLHIEERTNGFDGSYSGSGDEPNWFGINLGQIDECNAIDGQWLINKLTVTDDIKRQYKELLDHLTTIEGNEEFLEKLKSFEPKVMILWGSS